MHTETVGIFASKSYIGAHGVPTSDADLESRHWITLSQSGGTKGMQYFYREGMSTVIAPDTFSSCNSPLFIEQMVRKGLGIGCLLPAKASADKDGESLIHIMPELKGPTLSVSLVYPNRKLLPLRTRCLIDYFTQEGINRLS